MKGYIVPPTGPIVPAPDGLHEDLRGMHAALGCDMVQRVEMRVGEMWCDEESKVKANPPAVNPRATQIFCDQHPSVAQPILGTVYFRLRAGFEMRDDGEIVAGPADGR